MRVQLDGREQAIEARVLVPGDILLLAGGNAVGAGARQIEEAVPATVEEALTGASVPVAAAFGWFVWRQSAGSPYDFVRTETFAVRVVCRWFNVLNSQSATRSAMGFGIIRDAG